MNSEALHTKSNSERNINSLFEVELCNREMNIETKREIIGLTYTFKGWDPVVRHITWILGTMKKQQKLWLKTNTELAWILYVYVPFMINWRTSCNYQKNDNFKSISFSFKSWWLQMAFIFLMNMLYDLMLYNT